MTDIVQKESTITAIIFYVTTKKERDGKIKPICVSWEKHPIVITYWHFELHNVQRRNESESSWVGLHFLCRLMRIEYIWEEKYGCQINWSNGRSMMKLKSRKMRVWQVQVCYH